MARRALATLLTLLAFVLSTLALPATSFAKNRVEIARVEIPVGVSQGKERDNQVARSIRRLAHASLAHLDFGKNKVEVTIVVKELVIEQISDELIRVRCTLIGKLKGGGTAKSRLAFSGKPARKKQLTRQVLTAVTDGVMTRLAELARAKAKNS